MSCKTDNGFAYPLSTITGRPRAIVIQRCGMKLAGVNVASRSFSLSSSGVRFGRHVEELLLAPPRGGEVGARLAVGSACHPLPFASPCVHQSAPQAASLHHHSSHSFAAAHSACLYSSYLSACCWNQDSLFSFSLWRRISKRLACSNLHSFFSFSMARASPAPTRKQKTADEGQRYRMKWGLVDEAIDSDRKWWRGDEWTRWHAGW